MSASDGRPVSSKLARNVTRLSSLLLAQFGSRKKILKVVRAKGAWLRSDFPSEQEGQDLPSRVKNTLSISHIFPALALCTLALTPSMLTSICSKSFSMPSPPIFFSSSSSAKAWNHTGRASSQGGRAGCFFFLGEGGGASGKGSSRGAFALALDLDVLVALVVAFEGEVLEVVFLEVEAAARGRWRVSESKWGVLRRRRLASADVAGRARLTFRSSSSGRRNTLLLPLLRRRRSHFFLARGQDLDGLVFLFVVRADFYSSTFALGFATTAPGRARFRVRRSRGLGFLLAGRARGCSR